MKSQCPYCKVGFEIDESRIPERGASLKCPKCNKRFVLMIQPFSSDTATLENNHQTADETNKSDITPNREPLKNLDDTTKVCPSCEKIIKLEAIKCRHCGKLFEKDDVEKKVENKKIAQEYYENGAKMINEYDLIDGIKSIKKATLMGHMGARDYLSQYIYEIKSKYFIDKTVKCPFCAEEIKYIDDICTYCNEKIDSCTIDIDISIKVIELQSINLDKGKKNKKILAKKCFEEGINYIKLISNGIHDYGGKYIVIAAKLGNIEAQDKARSLNISFDIKEPITKSEEILLNDIEIQNVITDENDFLFELEQFEKEQIDCKQQDLYNSELKPDKESQEVDSKENSQHEQIGMSFGLKFVLSLLTFFLGIVGFGILGETVGHGQYILVGVMIFVIFYVLGK